MIQYHHNNIKICGPEVLFETCVTKKFVDDDDNNQIVILTSP